MTIQTRHRRLLRPHRDRTITVEGSPGVVVNVDTPEDYAAITGV